MTLIPSIATINTIDSVGYKNVLQIQSQTAIYYGKFKFKKIGNLPHYFRLQIFNRSQLVTFFIHSLKALNSQVLLF